MMKQDVQQLALGPQWTGELEIVSAENSQSAYKTDRDLYRAFYRGVYGEEPVERTIDDAVFAAWIRDMAQRGLAYETIRRRAASIASLSKAWRAPDDSKWIDPRSRSMAHAALTTVRRELRSRKMRRYVVFRAGMQAMIDKLDADFRATPLPNAYQTLLYLRDRLLILMLYMGPLSRIEAATLHVEDVVFDVRETIVEVNPTGEIEVKDASGSVLEVFWRDPDRKHKVVFEACKDVAYDVRIGLERWLRASAITEGYVFQAVTWDGKVTGNRMHPKAIRMAIARAAANAGLAVEAVDDAENAAPAPRGRRGGTSPATVQARINPRALRAGGASDRVAEGGPDAQRLLISRMKITRISDGLSDAIHARKELPASVPLTILEPGPASPEDERPLGR